MNFLIEKVGAEARSARKGLSRPILFEALMFSERKHEGVQLKKEDSSIASARRTKEKEKSEESMNDYEGMEVSLWTCGDDFEDLGILGLGLKRLEN
jgi:hypothetical protein